MCLGQGDEEKALSDAVPRDAEEADISQLQGSTTELSDTADGVGGRRLSGVPFLAVQVDDALQPCRRRWAERSAGGLACGSRGAGVVE